MRSLLALRRKHENKDRELTVSQAESPNRIHREQTGEVSVEDVRELMGASTPHFALQLRNRISRMIAGLPQGHPARVEGEREISRLERLGTDGETRGEEPNEGEQPMPSLSLGRSHGHEHPENARAVA